MEMEVETAAAVLIVGVVGACFSAPLVQAMVMMVVYVMLQILETMVEMHEVLRAGPLDVGRATKP